MTSYIPYNTVETEEFFGDSVKLAVSFLDNGAKAQVIVTLKNYSLATGKSMPSSPPTATIPLQAVRISSKRSTSGTRGFIAKKTPAILKRS